MKNSQSQSRVVVITSRNDAHVPFVQKHLNQPLIVIDPRDVATGTPLSFDLVGDKIIVSYDGEKLDDVSGVWYRKPQPIMRREIPVKDDYKLYSQNALERHFMQLQTAFEDATWVSDYFKLNRANNKTLQTALARRVGFNVPETLVTSDEAAAAAFVQAHDQCISKPLTVAYPKVDGVQKILLTTLVNKDNLDSLKNLHLAPSIFQVALAVKHDVRVIVVGDRAFGAIVRSDVHAESHPDNAQLQRVRDNRVGHYEGTVHITELQLPKDIADKCIAHTKSIGLNFGAIDLIIDDKDTWWFLENNPNGQWAYIENETSHPISKTLADLLTKAR